MRLLVTRPEPDAGETAARLAAMGHAVMVQPMLRVVFAPAPAVLIEPAALVATSRNGVRALATWPAAAAWRGRPLFVTGEGTARTAGEAGFADVRAGDAAGAALAALIIRDLRAGAGPGPLLYAAARDRSGALEDTLAAAGHDLRVVEAYRAEPAAELDPAVADALRARSIDGILFFSRRTAETFAALADAAGLAATLRGVTLYALSERVAEPLRQFEGADIRITASPDADALIGLVGGG